MTCIDCGDDWVDARDRCFTCYNRAIKAGVIQVLYPNVKPEEVERMKELRAQGLGWLRIARAVGRNKTTVRRHILGL